MFGVSKRSLNGDKIFGGQRDTGLTKAIHSEYLDKNLNKKQLAIKKGIIFGLTTISCEKDWGIKNTQDTEARIMMAFISDCLEELEK